MKNFFNKKFSTKTKLISSAISLMLIVCFAITGTVAWLVDATEEVTDTFTYGKVEIKLLDGDVLPNTVTKWNDSTHSNNPTYSQGIFKLIPGAPIKFNPVVRVVSGSEDCYVFVKITEKNNTNGIDVDLAIVNDWNELESGVYYQKVENITRDKDLSIFENGGFTVSKDITNTVIGNLDSITIKAYAIQSEYLVDNQGNTLTAPADIWALINN